MPEEPRFNPHYSPEFQRGYEPQAPRPPQEPADAGGSPAGGSVTEAAGTDDTAADDTAAHDTAAHDTAADGKGAEDTGAGGTAAGAGDSRASAAPSRSSLWRNPYVIVLLVAGVLLILGGVQLYFRSIESMYVARESTPQDMVTVQVLWGLAPVVMTAGVFTLIGVGFLAAYRWRQGRP